MIDSMNGTLLANLVLLLGAFLAQGVNSDPQCTGYDHPNYGKSGECVATSECPGDKYISNLCPTHPNDVKCCFTVDSDEMCISYDNPAHGQVGYCVETDKCPADNYISGYCPTKPANVKCCFSKPGVDCNNLPIISRSQWGARATTSQSSLSLPVQYAFIHHTAGPTCDSQSSCSSVVRGIQNYHMDTRGWEDIGYSFLVGGDGNIYEGRGWDRVGAHTSGYNDNGLAWAFIGSFSEILPNELALTNAKAAIACGATLGKLSSQYTLLGHRDKGQTTCPGDKLYAEIKSWPNYNQNDPEP